MEDRPPPRRPDHHASTARQRDGAARLRRAAAGSARDRRTGILRPGARWSDALQSGQSGAVAEHALLVYITSLPADAGVDEIEDPLIEAIEAAAVGEFDGNEIGPDGAVLYMYGPDADALFAAVEPILRTAPLGPGSHAVKRYGEPGASESRVELK